MKIRYRIYEPKYLGTQVSILHNRFCSCYCWKVVAKDSEGNSVDSSISGIWSYKSRGFRVLTPDKNDTVVEGDTETITWRYCPDSRYDYDPTADVKILLGEREQFCGSEWYFQEIVTVPNTGSYSWDTSCYSESDDYFIQIVAKTMTAVPPYVEEGYTANYWGPKFSLIDTDGPCTSTTTTTIKYIPGCDVTISPKTAAVDSGETKQFKPATVCDSSTMTHRPYEWTIDSQIGSTISKDGLYEAGINTKGTQITEKVKVIDIGYGLSDTATVTVSPVDIEISITPNETAVVTEGTKQFSAKTTINGVEAEGSIYEWEVQESSIGSTIDNDGLYRAGKITDGKAVEEKVKATDTNYGVSATAAVTVSPYVPTPEDFVIT